MALRGTLGDFGIADIFQLVGHQAKTGVLRLKNREDEVEISFVDGNVIKADNKGRHSRELLGNILVRADMITEAQLESALDEQGRTLKRLGKILVARGDLDMETLREFARLQTTETIYKLFRWDAGTYEFNQEPVDWDRATDDAIRADNILMEGFRMVDEWPSIRAVIPHAELSFSRLKPLPETSEQPKVKTGGFTIDDELDLALGLDGPPPPQEGDTVGPGERLVYGLVTPGRTVDVIVDKSRMGEFETSKALANLVRTGFLAPEGNKSRTSVDASVSSSRFRTVVVPLITRIMLYVLVAVIAGVIVKVLSLNETGILSSARPEVVSVGAGQSAIATLQKQRLRRFVERHRLQTGHYPSGLKELTDDAGIDPRELSFPFRDPYAYRKKAGDPLTGTSPSFAIGQPLR